MESSLRGRIVALQFGFNITIKPDGPSFFPILGVVFIDAGAMPQKTVKLASRRVDHNPDMSAPHYQVARLRFFHPAKIISAAVEIARTRIRIRKARLFINGMHQV